METASWKRWRDFAACDCMMNGEVNDEVDDEEVKGTHEWQVYESEGPKWDKGGD